MACPNCGGDCDGGMGSAAEGESPHQNLRKLFVLEKSVAVVGGTNKETVVFTTPSASSIDVYALSPDGSATGVEIIRVYSRSRMLAGLVDSRQQSTFATSGHAIAIRDEPADAFDITLDPGTAFPGTTSTFNLVVVGWGQEPTGFGPNRISTVKEGESVTFGGAPAYAYVGQGLFAQCAASSAGASGSGIWHPLRAGYAGINPIGFAGWQHFLNVLPTGVYNATPPTVTDGQAIALQTDAAGDLKVALAGSAGVPVFPNAAALGDADANPTTTRVGADVQWFNGTTWDRGRSGSFGATGLSSVTGFGNFIPVLRFTSSPPTLTDGQAWFFQGDANGNLKNREQYQPVYEDNTNGVAATHDKPQTGTTYNATAADIIAKANTGVLKASAGNLYRLYVTNDNAAAQAYALVNKATNPATADTAIMYFYVPAKTTQLVEFRFGKRFSTGIAWAQVTTLGAATITLAGTSDSLVDAEVA